MGRLVREAGPAYTDADPNSNTFGQTIRPLTRRVYDNLGHLKQILAGKTSSDGGTTIDPDTGASGQDTAATQVSYVTDDFGRVLRETDAKGQVTTATYDLNGNVLTRQTSTGHTLTYQWTYGHRLREVEAEDGRRIHYIRNPMGAITRAETWSPSPSSLEVAYDYQYDAAHRLETLTDSRGTKTLIYDWSPGGLLNVVQDSEGHRADYLYDPVGRLIGIWAPNYDSYTFDYDAGGRLTEVRYPNGIAQTLVQSSYSYDGLGRRKTLSETLSGQATLAYTYQYDPLDRPTQVDNGTASQRQTYAYDALGNRVQKQLGNPVSSTLAYKFDLANQLTEVRNGSLTGTLLEAYLHDNAGHQTQKCAGGTVTRPSDSSCTGASQTQYGYDSFNRLAQLSGTTTASFRYDDQGRRIQKTEGATTTHYRYDGQNLWSEAASATGAPSAVYVQAGLDRPLARLTGATNLPTASAAYYHQDGLNSVLATTNASKTVTAIQRFDAFGLKLAGAGSIPQYGYTGREPDLSGLVYYRARYYDPNQGRFTQRDPLGYLDGINP